jgi:hypothetical protein
METTNKIFAGLAKSFLVAIALFLFTSSLFSQKETYKWTFGQGVGLDFTGGSSPVTFSHSLTGTKVYESTASICDGTGALLFYTNGYSVYDKNGALMSGGNQTLKTGLGGTNGSAVQGVTIVKHPSSSLYYIFTTDAANDATDYGFNYATVDISQNSGLGAVTAITRLKDENNANFNTTEEVGATLASNGYDIWVVTHEYKSGGSSEFLAYKVTASAVTATPVVTSIGYNYTTKDEGRGTMIFSGSSTHAAVVHHHQNWPYNSAIELYNFDNAAGTLSGLLTLGNTNWSNYASAYSAVFSPDASKLYVTFIAYQGIVQYDLASWGNQAVIKASETLISGSTSGEYGQMKVGPDGVLYKARVGTSYVATVSGNLNGAASSLTYTNNGIALSPTGTSSYSMPNMYAPANASLPVKLISFTADKKEKNIELIWSLASAINNDYFIVEHSSDGETFTALEKINGVGNTSAIKTMEAIDHSPFAGMNYYRLKMVDYDASFEYSTVAAINMEVNIFTLPFNYLKEGENLLVNYSVEESAHYTVTVYGMEGQLKYAQEIILSSGQGQLVLPSDLSNGIYLLVINKNNAIVLSRRFLIQ